jgi:hypothetical protein
MVKLKPSDLQLTGRYRSISDHEKLLKSKINSLTNKLVKSVCLDILDSPPGAKINIVGLKQPDINEIKNYFAEVAAPILVKNNNLITGISKTSKVFYSDSDTERLYDFKLLHNNKEILVSNKQLKGGTNTLKPGDVIRLVDSDSDLTKKWKKTKYYNIFKILDDNNVISGPMKAISEEYPNKHPIKKLDYTRILEKMDKNEVMIQPKEIPEPLMRLIKADPIAYAHYVKNGAAAGTMLNFLFEKSLVEESKKDGKYHELFVDVTSGNVQFFKFDISNKGILQYGISDPKESTKKAILRSKQGVERRSSSSGRLKLDKLGFQP